MDPVPTASPALDLLRSVLRELGRRRPALRRHRLEALADAWRVQLDLDGGRPLGLRVSNDRDGPAFARSPSFGLAVQAADGAPLSAAEAALLADLVGLLQARDPGGLSLPLARAEAPALAPLGPLPDTPELHRAAFLAWKALTTEDLYPHVTPLGDLIDDRTLLQAWSGTLRRIDQGTAPSKLGLYIHIPFCATACSFCYCAKTDRFSRTGMEAYIDRLLAEIAFFAPTFQGATFTSVYFGGGTPSMLSVPALRRLFTALHGTFHIPAGTQIIFEGNPDSLSPEKIEVLAGLGRVTRLTVGVQALDEEVQRRVRRFNKPEQVASAIQAARRCGIAHVNVDLMAGLPGQSLESFLADLDFLIALEPDSVHLNSYRPLPRVRLEERGEDRMDEARIALRAEMMRRANARLEEAGHNIRVGGRTRRTANAANLQEYDLRRQNSSLLGLGFPSRAHAFGAYYYAPDTRPGIEGGIEQWTAGGGRWLAVPSDDLEEQHKYLISNLRTGFPRAEFRQLFGRDCRELEGDPLGRLEALGLLRVGEERVEAAPHGQVQYLVLRGLLYSPAFLARALARWGGEYEPETDYAARIAALVNAEE